MNIRNVLPSDAPRLLEIYAPYVLETAVSFEYDVPDVEGFVQRIEKTTEKYPYLAAEENGVIVGYCYAGAFHPRKAYERSVEVSIYVDKAFRQRGIGRALYEKLEESLNKIGVKNLYACIAYTDRTDDNLTNDSVLFHEKMGYKKCGHFTGCGEKFGKLYDMIYMEKTVCF